MATRVLSRIGWRTVVATVLVVLLAEFTAGVALVVHENAVRDRCSGLRSQVAERPECAPDSDTRLGTLHF